jgi:hypothetical protein
MRVPMKSISVFLASRWQNGCPATNIQVKVHVGRTCAEELAPSKDRIPYISLTQRKGMEITGKVSYCK